MLRYIIKMNRKEPRKEFSLDCSNAHTQARKIIEFYTENKGIFSKDKYLIKNRVDLNEKIEIIKKMLNDPKCKGINTNPPFIPYLEKALSLHLEKKKVKKVVKEPKKEEAPKKSNLKIVPSKGPMKEEPAKKKKLKIVSKNVPNDKLKCFMLKAKNGGMYRTCATPEKKKQPKTQVRDDPIPSSLREKPYIRAYPNAKERRKAQNQRTKAKKAKKD